MRRRYLLRARPQNNQYAGKSNDDGCPAPPADVLAEQRYRQRRNHKWRCEPECQSIDERHAGQAIEKTEHRADGKQRADQVPTPATGPKAAKAAELPRQQQEDGNADDAA